MRAKFRCNSVTFLGDPDNADTTRTYQLHAVYDDRTPENARFAKATPFGELKMTIDNPAARLNIGEAYYLDFTPCAIAEAVPATMGNTHAVPAGERYTETIDASGNPTDSGVRSGTYTES